MGCGKELDTIGRAAWREVRGVLLLLLVSTAPAFPQDNSIPQKITAIKSLYDAQRWPDVVAATENAPETPGDFGLYRGLALAHLERWDEAQKAFESSLKRNAGDARLMTELAGLAYRQKQYKPAKEYLRKALQVSPTDTYGENLLASIYFLEGNLEAALKHWNRAGKPRLFDLTFEPVPKLKPILMDRAFAFSRGSVWKKDDYLTTKARLDGLRVFQVQRFDLEAKENDTFDLAYRATEKPGWKDSPWIAAASFLSGAPYQTVYAEFPEMSRSGLQWNSSFRWDDQKRRVTSEVAGPLKDNPAWRYRVQVDLRNENWNLTDSLAPATPSPAFANLEKATIEGEIQAIPSGLWYWSTGAVYSYRRMRNPLGLPAAAAPFFSDGSNLGLRGKVRRALVRYPEGRFTLDERGNAELGTFFQDPLGRYFRMAGDLDSRWLPQARGDDYETRVRLRAGRTFGEIPFDELYVLGFDRDTELWMRGHPGLTAGQKGSAPLGRGYVLTNAEADKIILHAPFISFRLGPFLDTGKTYDSSGYFGSQKWTWDTGAQLKIRVLGSFEFVLGYGRDLRSGRNSFFTTVTR
jgi:tetratricopeptide repeat protein